MNYTYAIDDICVIEMCYKVKIIFNILAEIDAQISTKLKEIERMKLEVSSLKLKRKRCDIECDRLHKRLMSCDSALKEIPASHSSATGM